MLRSLSPTLLQILGMFMLIRGFTAWRESGQLEITTAQLVAVVVVGLTALLLARFADPVVRFCADHRVALVIPMASGAALGFSPRFLLAVIWWHPVSYQGGGPDPFNRGCSSGHTRSEVVMAPCHQRSASDPACLIGFAWNVIV